MNAADVGFPYSFRLSEYECVWTEGSREDGEDTGGCVAVRVAHTGDDDRDWYESDVVASTTEEAAQIARSLIALYEEERS